MGLDAVVGGVPVFRWNPKRPLGKNGRLESVNNFGDLLGPLIVGRLAEGLSPSPVANSARLLTVGSILHYAETSDVVWGSGVNGKVPIDEIDAGRLDVRAVRGPKTRDILTNLGYDVPEIYGDPALLLPVLFPDVAEWTKFKQHPVTIVPNFNDLDAESLRDQRVVSPTAPLWDVVRTIAESEFVTGSSLHGTIVAEALGVPVRPCSSPNEDDFKYADYFAGTGRNDVQLAEDIDNAFDLGPVEPIDMDFAPLLESFPSDLWLTGTPSQTDAEMAKIPGDSGTRMDPENSADIANGV